ncbi:MAG: hypothetical protein R6X13_07145 [bacterium]
MAQAIARAAGLDLDAAGRKLYVDLGSAAGRLDSSDVRGPALLLAGRRLPLGTDLVVVGPDTTNLEGITVLSDGNGHVYGPASLLTDGRPSSSDGENGGSAR